MKSTKKEKKKSTHGQNPYTYNNNNNSNKIKHIKYRFKNKLSKHKSKNEKKQDLDPIQGLSLGTGGRQGLFFHFYSNPFICISNLGLNPLKPRNLSNFMSNKVRDLLLTLFLILILKIYHEYFNTYIFPADLSFASGSFHLK